MCVEICGMIGRRLVLATRERKTKERKGKKEKWIRNEGEFLKKTPTRVRDFASMKLQAEETKLIKYLIQLFHLDSFSLY